MRQLALWPDTGLPFLKVLCSLEFLRLGRPADHRPSHWNVSWSKCCSLPKPLCSLSRIPMEMFLWNRFKSQGEQRASFGIIVFHPPTLSHTRWKQSSQIAWANLGLVRAYRSLKTWGPFFNGLKCLIYIKTNSWDSPSAGITQDKQSPNKSPPTTSARGDCHHAQRATSADLTQRRALESVKSGICYFRRTNNLFDPIRDKNKAKQNQTIRDRCDWQKGDYRDGDGVFLGMYNRQWRTPGPHLFIYF